MIALKSRFLFVSIILLGCNPTVPAQGTRNECLECHRNRTPDVFPSDLLEVDVHIKEGLSCSSCHGGNPHVSDESTAKAEETGYVGKPTPAQVPEFCGKCHSDAEYMRRFRPGLAVDQVQKYATSHHGQLLAEGAQDVATCVSCHGSHGIRTTKDPLSPVFPTNVPETCAGCHGDAQHMAPYQISTDQFVQYQNSVHGKALLERRDIGAPACNDCHGNHGAQPPDVASINHVCGQCHPYDAELVRKSFHHVTFEALEEPECGVCHGNHNIEKPSYRMISMSGDGICSNCHADEALDAALFTQDDIVDVRGVISRISGRSGSDIYSQIRLLLSEETQGEIASMDSEAEISEMLKSHLILDLNKILFERSLLKNNGLNNLVLRPETETLIQIDGLLLSGEDLRKRNRLLMEDAFPQEIKRIAPSDPSIQFAESLYHERQKLEQRLTEAEAILNLVRKKGMIVDDILDHFEAARAAQFKVRTLFHAFDIEQYQTACEEGIHLADQVIHDADLLLSEVKSRRIGLAISSCLITMMAIGLYFKIREIENPKKSNSESEE